MKRQDSDVMKRFTCLEKSQLGSVIDFLGFFDPNEPLAAGQRTSQPERSGRISGASTQKP